MSLQKEIILFYKKTSKWPYRSNIEKWENLGPIFNFLKLQPSDRLLDVGCGSGVFVQKAKKICRAFGVDLYPAQSLPHIFRAYAEKLPFKPNSFSVVYLSKSFLLINKNKALKEIKRVLKPRGKLFIRELLYSPLWDKVITRTKSRLLGQKAPVTKNNQKIKKIIIQNLKKNDFKIKNIFRFQTRLVYPSQKLLIERFLYYSPLIKLKNMPPPRQLNKWSNESIIKVEPLTTTTF